MWLHPSSSHYSQNFKRTTMTQSRSQSKSAPITYRQLKLKNEAMDHPLRSRIINALSNRLHLPTPAQLCAILEIEIDVLRMHTNILKTSSLIPKDYIV
jgi:hypothetical protein